MPSATVTITKWNKSHIANMVKNACADALNDAAQDGVEAAQGKAPVDTGRMRDDIQVTKEATPNDLVADFGSNNVDYTLWVEIGSQGRPGRYFLRYGLDVAKHKLMTRLKGAFK